MKSRRPRSDRHPRGTAWASLALAAAGLVACSAPQRDATGADDAVACEILIVGGSLGGCAAALGAAGRDVWLVEDSPWVGGQITSQGVSALDEHAYVETFGGTARYARLRERIREESGGRRNPGGGWVSRLCFEPRVGLTILEDELARSGAKVLRETRLVAAETRGDLVVRVTFERADGGRVSFAPRFVLEASDLGDLHPLAGIEHRVGTDARAETGEPHAAERADPARLQSYTYPFVVEWRPGESHVIPEPPDYARNRERQPYSLALRTAEGRDMRFGFFEKLPGSVGPFWIYRSIGPDLAMINWPGNDFRGASVLEPDHSAAKYLSLGFLRWLQTECPRDDGGLGYPELKLRPDVLGTHDGLSMRPYVREGRRLVARTTIREQDVTGGAGARARSWSDSVGLGWYPIDVHAASGDVRDSGGLALPTKPFQIPLGAMLPARVRNVIAAGKAMGTTHVTNGCYRLHPVEWSVGEAAGELAGFCLERGVEPHAVHEDELLLRAFQRRILERGLPIFWYVDLVRRGDALFVAAQLAAVSGLLAADPDTLEFGADPERARRAIEAAGSLPR